MEKIKKYVIAGPPCSGKTTIIEHLKNMGYETVEEAARKIILNQLNGDKILPWTNKIEFQKLVLELGLKYEKNVKTSPVFIDCGIPSGIAYFVKDGLEIPKELEEASKNASYDTIFLLEPLSNYKKDDARKESEEDVPILYSLIKSTYESLGYNVIHVPAGTVEKRIQLIMESI